MNLSIGKRDIWTVGYQRWPSKIRWAKLVAALKSAKIEVLCDIRHSPCSSALDPADNYGPRTWHLQPGGGGIAPALAAVGIEYRWFVELGNPQKNDPAMAVLKEQICDASGVWPIQRGLTLLSELLECRKRCCLMCACKAYQDCHRKIVAEALANACVLSI